MRAVGWQGDDMEVFVDHGATPNPADMFKLDLIEFVPVSCQLMGNLGLMLFGDGNLQCNFQRSSRESRHEHVRKSEWILVFAFEPKDRWYGNRSRLGNKIHRRHHEPSEVYLRFLVLR
jgi:hypothetical protein